MKRDCEQTSERTARGDEGRTMATSLILFIVSTILRHLGPDAVTMIIKLKSYLCTPYVMV